MKDIAKSTKEEIADYDLLIFGIPTWYYGEAQCDWDDFFSQSWKKLISKVKSWPFSALGDQEDYAEYFLDAMGMIRDIVEARGGIIIGHWSTEGYHFEESKGMADAKPFFVGLGIDEDRQPELTQRAR